MAAKKDVAQDARDMGEEWEISRRYTNLYGEVPSSFSSLIRGLVADQQKNGELSFSTKWQMNRLLRSLSMKAAYYFALRTYRKELFAGGAPVTAEDMITAFRPVDLAALLGVLYLYRRARGVADPNEWKFVAPVLHTRCDLGGQIGIVMENVGFALGLLAGSMRGLAMVAFHLHDKSGFADYRRQLKLSGKPYDLEAERKRWRCTHIQISSNLLVAVGLGGILAETVCKGMEMQGLNVEEARSKPYAVKVAESWIDSLIAGGKPPEIVHSGLYYPLKEDLQRLISEAHLSVSAGSQFFWLDKGKASINPKDTPELVGQPSAPAPDLSQSPEVTEDIAGGLLDDE